MNFQFFVENDYASINNFEQIVQIHAKKHDYAIIKERFKNDRKIKNFKKINIKYNRNDFFKQRNITTVKRVFKKQIT